MLLFEHYFPSAWRTLAGREWPAAGKLTRLTTISTAKQEGEKSLQAECAIHIFPETFGYLLVPRKLSASSPQLAPKSVVHFRQSIKVTDHQIAVEILRRVQSEVHEIFPDFGPQTCTSQLNC